MSEVTDADIDAVLHCTLGDMPGHLHRRIEAREITPDQAITLFRSAVVAITLAFLSIFVAQKRRDLAVTLLAGIGRGVLDHEVTGGADVQRAH